MGMSSPTKLAETVARLPAHLAERAQLTAAALGISLGATVRLAAARQLLTATPPKGPTVRGRFGRDGAARDRRVKFYVPLRMKNLLSWAAPLDRCGSQSEWIARALEDALDAGVLPGLHEMRDKQGRLLFNEALDEVFSAEALDQAV